MSEQTAEVVLSLDEVHALALRVLTHHACPTPMPGPSPT
ncbi:Delta(1)-pyrroline-2-carboxylate reductase 1 [Burkholderia cepacia]|nr:Delta(1)-pyrroline-2-carboxylate reductase 1 [Burkholderia cepacia]